MNCFQKENDLCNSNGEEAYLSYKAQEEKEQGCVFFKNILYKTGI